MKNFQRKRSFDETLLWYFGLDGQKEFQRLLTTGTVPQQSCLIPTLPMR